MPYFSSRWAAVILLGTAFAACSNTPSGTIEELPSNSNSPATSTPSNDGNGQIQALGPNTVVASQPNATSPRLVARTDLRDANGPIFSWSGSRILVGFTGTQLTVSLKELDYTSYEGTPTTNIMGVSIDGGAMTRVQLEHGVTDYLVAKGLVNGPHQVTVNKLTEGQTGRTQFLGAKTDGTLTYTPPIFQRRIEFIGDSAAAGYGADGNSPCTYSTATENATVAYPMMTGTLLNADVHACVYSGKGIIQNRDMADDSYKTLAVLWGWTLPNDTNQSDWTPSSWIPQAVVMTVGGNDFYWTVPTQTQFQTAMVAFIKRVTTAYPLAHVFVGVSPQLRDDETHDHPNVPQTKRSLALSWTPALVAGMNNPNIHFIDLPFDDGSRGYGCDMHLNRATHLLEAQYIAKTLKTTLGWQ